MSQFQQPQYQQPPQQFSPQQQFAPPPNFVPQSNGGQPGESLAQQVAKGIFPYMNRAEVVGQVFGTGQNTGVKWKDGQNGGEGHLEIELKLRKAWGGQNPGVKQTKIKLIAYGQLGQQIMNQIRPGMIVRAVGEIKVSNFKYTQGPKAGQWATTCQLQLRGGQNTEVPFEVLGGPLPIVDEAPRQQGYQQQGGGGYQQNNGGGYQQQGQQGGYQQPQQQQYQQQPPQQQYQQQAAPQFQQPQQPQQPQQFQQPAQQGQPVYQQPQGQPVYQQPAQNQQPPQFQPPQNQAPQGPIGAPPGQPGGTFLPPPGQPQQQQGAQQGNFQQPR